MRIATLGLILVSCFSTCLSATLTAQVKKHSENTFVRGDDFVAPSATLKDVRWIAGRWMGEAMGGNFEETWSPPSADSMTGMFKFTKDGTTKFFELLTIVPDGDSLIMRLKHFNPDLKGWEKQDEAEEFPLVRVRKNEVNFEGLTFRRIKYNQLKIFVVVSEEEGKANEIEFSCERATFTAPISNRDVSEIADGIYLVQRWSIEEELFQELLPGEVLLKHDLTLVEPETDEPVKFVTLKLAQGIPFDQLAAAKALSQDDGRKILEVQFSKSAAKKLEQLSRRNLGRQVAIVFDGQITTMHKIRSVIRGGNLMISRCTDNGCETIMKSIESRSSK